MNAELFNSFEKIVVSILLQRGQKPSVCGKRFGLKELLYICFICRNNDESEGLFNDPSIIENLKNKHVSRLKGFSFCISSTFCDIHNVVLLFCV